MSTPTKTIEARHLRPGMQLVYKPSELQAEEHRAMFSRNVDLCGTIVQVDRLSLTAGERVGVKLALDRSLIIDVSQERTIEVPDVSPMVASVPKATTFRSISIE